MSVGRFFRIGATWAALWALLVILLRLLKGDKQHNSRRTIDAEYTVKD